MEKLTVKCNLHRLMGEHRHKLQDVANETGLSRSTLTRLYYNQGGAVHFDTIAALCALYKCSVGDLLEVVPEGKL